MSGYGLLLRNFFSGQGWRDALNAAEEAGGENRCFFLPVTDYFWNIFLFDGGFRRGADIRILNPLHEPA
ncbi:hypothetical protein [uncultured Akkermansia sp.]|uniref:hypothetical protein n=1 Tax=uncultured Akkermansia sp. TaxID=512294 RepID=UPI00260E79E3|nr:hypothetical protein [uncultured Akkermansia sp.]